MSFIYFIEPEDPTGDQLVEINRFLEKMGYSLAYEASEETYLMSQVGNMILKHGITTCLSFQDLEEEILPDNMLADVLKDTLRYKLKMMIPVNELLLIDPYIFPANYDGDYLSFVETILSDAIESVSILNIVTLSNRNQNLESQFFQMVRRINPNITHTIKYTRIFHDRFWIVDKKRGMFIGTSLNGIGRRYAVVDYLQPDDTKNIYARFEQIV